LFLISKRNGVREALKKLHHDYDLGRIQQGNYNDLKRGLDEKLEKIDAKIAASYAQIAEITEGA
jgi:hypothetical protein